MRFLEQFLEKEVRPALCCTEPGAIAFCVALAASKLEGNIEKVAVTTSVNVYKNGMYVGIPGTNEKGNEFAAALGAVCGDAALQLEALRPCRIESVDLAREMIDKGQISVICDQDLFGVFIEALLSNQNHSVLCRIIDSHTNVVLLQIDEKEAPSSKEYVPSEALEFTPEEIFESIEGITEIEIKKIFEGIDMNLEIARFGLKEMLPSAENFRDCENNSLGYRIRRYCIAASAARMSGVPLPVMSSGGSGNQGIVATLPVALTGEHFQKSREDIAKAVAISHLFAGYIKSKLGRVAPICGCVTAAGTGPQQELPIFLEERGRLSNKRCLQYYLAQRGSCAMAQKRAVH